MKKVNSLKEIIKTEIQNNKELKKEFLKSNWEDIVGKALAKKSEAMYIRKDTIYILVENSAWMQQMQFLQRDIINKVNEALDGIFINKIFFKVGKKTYKAYKIEKSESLNKIEIDNISLETEDIYEIKKVLEKIEDLELKKSFYKIMTKNRKREIFLLKEGYKRCKNCGSLYNEIDKICTSCNLKIEKERSSLIYEMISKQPMIKYHELKSIISDLGKDEFEKVNKNYIDKELLKIYVLKKENKELELKKAVARYLIAKEKSKNNILERVELFIQSFT